METQKGINWSEVSVGTRLEFTEGDEKEGSHIVGKVLSNDMCGFQKIRRVALNVEGQRQIILEAEKGSGEYGDYVWEVVQLDPASVGLTVEKFREAARILVEEGATSIPDTLCIRVQEKRMCLEFSNIQESLPEGVTYGYYTCPNGHMLFVTVRGHEITANYSLSLDRGSFRIAA